MCEICVKFNSFDYHDSKLRTFKIVRRLEDEGIVEDFCLEIDLLTEFNDGVSSYSKSILTLKDCSFIEIKLNLIDKQACSDDIGAASCTHYEDDVDLYFRISMIDSGYIDIFASNFELSGVSN